MRFFPLIVLALTTFVSAAPKSVAIFELVNLSGEPSLNHLSASLPKSLRVSLLAGTNFTVSEPDATLAALAAPPAPGEGVPFNEALKAADKLKAEIAVVGSFALVDETIQINLEAIDTKTRRVRTSASVSGPSTGPDLFDTVDEVCGQMAERMSRELPAELKTAKKNVVVNVEEIYLSSSRKNSWFYALAGAGPVFVMADYGQKIVTGFGYKRIRFRMSGNPPVFRKSSSGEMTEQNMTATYDGGMEPMLEYVILPGRLVANAGYVWNSVSFDAIATTSTYTQVSSSWINYNLIELGARVKVASPLWLSFRIGMPLSAAISLPSMTGQTFENLPSTVRMVLEADWRIKGALGFKLMAQWIHSDSKTSIAPEIGWGRLRTDAFVVHIGPCYNMEF
jgi:TolB-like protein